MTIEISIKHDKTNKRDLTRNPTNGKKKVLPCNLIDIDILPYYY